MRIASTVLATALAAFAAPCAAQVEERSTGFYITPLVNAVRVDDDRGVDDDPAFSLAAGFESHRRWNLELNLFRGRFAGAGNDDLTMEAIGVDALHVFRRDARVAPYVLVGIGSQSKDRTLGGSSTDGYAEAGAGFLTTLRRSETSGRELSLRFDLRARYDDADGGSRLDHILGIGLQYALGVSVSAPAPAAAPEPPPPPPPPPADEDQDGVPDSRDRCPGTATGTVVDADGCELDSDGDGVVDSTPDECPRTPPETRIDARGCELEAEIELPFVTFEFDSDRLQPEGFATLDQAITTLRMNPDLAIEVAGHTDSVGSAAYNLSLSERRAETVRRYLVDNGVTNVLTARGYGEGEPVANNGTEAGRAENRRVVLRILSQ